MTAIAAHPLIAEARRRARRRRLGLVLLLVGVGAAAFFALRPGGSAVPARAVEALRSSKPLLPAPNGPLTMVYGDVRAVGPGGLGSTLFHCGPAHRCWELESLAWSPDGVHLAFGVMSIGGAPRYDGLHIGDTSTGAVRIIKKWRRGHGEWLQLAWSADGQRLAAIHDSRIVVMNADGSGARVVPTGTTERDSSPTWSRDGTRLAFASGSTVYTIRLDGTQRRVLARHAAWPAWSPDGKVIAVLSCGGVKLLSPSGRDLTAPGSYACPHVGMPGAPVWSPDGRSIAMVTGTRSGSGVKSAYRDRGVWTMNADGSGLRRWTKLTPRSVAGSVAGSWKRPAWRASPFPTGTFLAKFTAADLYSSGLDTNDAHWETVTFNADGTWRDVWFHPRVADQPPASGRYVVKGDTVRLLGTPDTVRWSYANGRLTFRIVHVPDRLARFLYTAHPWRKIR